MKKQFILLFMTILLIVYSYAQSIKTPVKDTSDAYRANDRLRTAGPKDGWKGKTDSSGKGSGTIYPYIHVDIPLGMAQTSSINLPSYLKTRSRFSYGAGLGVVFGDNRTGRISTGIYYQSAGMVAEGKDPSGSTINNKVQFHFLKIPLQYQFYIDKAKRIFIGAGGYGGLLISKKQSTVFFNFNNLSKTDAGLMASAGYWLSPRWILQANAQWGMTDIDNSSGVSLEKNSIYFLTISFVPSSRAGRKPIYGPIIKIKPKG